MQQFVCARIPQANGIDLTRFQFDYDLTFAVFFLNADGALYGRYGTRSSREDATQDMSLNGLAEALSGALLLHQNYPQNKESLRGKQAAAMSYKTPDDFPSLRGKYQTALNYRGNVVRSCLHCHQIGDAQRSIYRDSGKPIPDRFLFPHPMPDVIGIKLDPQERARIVEVKADSAASAAGLRNGDEILTLQGQPILSIADVQWVLHQANEAEPLQVLVRRAGQLMPLTVQLKKDWRRASDISWRVMSWGLRRMGTGGLRLAELPPADRSRMNLDASRLALIVQHVGQYGAHAVAKKAGFKKGDILISFNGLTDAMSESQLLAYAAQHTKAGDRVGVTVLRGDRQIHLTLRMQK